MTNQTKDLEALALRLGKAQKRVILALSEDWGPSPDHQCAKRMWYGIRGDVDVIHHKHRTDNCWRLNSRGLALQAILRSHSSTLEGGE